MQVSSGVKVEVHIKDGGRQTFDNVDALGFAEGSYIGSRGARRTLVLNSGLTAIVLLERSDQEMAAETPPPAAETPPVATPAEVQVQASEAAGAAEKT